MMMTKTNHELQQDVEQELLWDPAVAPATVGVSVTDHAVTLTGTVDKLSNRLAAVRATKRVKGVHAIADDIVVKLHGTSKHSDHDVAESIERSLRWSIETPDAVKATVRDGVVTLDGTVEWNFQRRAAERAVQNLMGVQRVENKIGLKHVETAAQIHVDIFNALRRTVDVDAGAIKVTSDGGEVSLDGTVSSWAERTVVEDAAWAARGVTNVHDRLVIR